MTRVQSERFASEEEYLRLQDCYILTPAKLKLAKPDMFILHPLPRVNEISTEVDNNPVPLTSSRSSSANLCAWR